MNTGGLAEGVFESELFGHVKGAFTDAKTDRVGRFEMADGGTLFLDEIANISQGLQAKLLRTLETGEFERVGSSKTRRVDVRVFSATNADLRRDVAEGKFRQDLLFRLNTIEICACLRCATGAKIFRCWRRTSCGSMPSITASRSRVSTKAPSRRCWRTPGRATCANWIMRWSARC